MTFPDGTPVFHEAILGNYQYKSITSEEDGFVVKTWFIYGAQSLVLKIDIPDLGPPTDKLEQQLLERLKKLKEMWREEDSELEVRVSSSPDEMIEPVVKLEFFTLNGYTQEFQRAMNQDIPLVFILGIVMMSFTCFTLYRPKEKVQSRGLLGILSFVTIGMSLITGFGLMFVCGVPLTSAGIMVPFVVVGVGLDDTYIILGAYFRRRREHGDLTTQSTEEKDTNAETVTLIEDTLDEVAISISMTTITTLSCFFVGSASSIPVVKWLSLYAGSTLGVDFIFQITYFIAFISLDERRVQANRRDLCFWIAVTEDDLVADTNPEVDLSLQEEQQYFKDAKENIEIGLETIEAGSEQTGQLDYSDDNPPKRGPNTGRGESDLNEKSDDRNETSLPVQDDEDVEKTRPQQQSETPSIESTQDANERWQSESSTTSTFKTAQQSKSEPRSAANRQQLDQNFMEKFMSWYADHLLKPQVKVLVIVLFLAYFAVCVYSTTILYQQFNVGDYVPKDSFLTSFMESFSQYTSLQRYIGVYFRSVQ
jgi:Patched family